MSHPVNDEILERLYEEAFEELCQNMDKAWLAPEPGSRDRMRKRAAEIAQERFEDLSQ